MIQRMTREAEILTTRRGILERAGWAIAAAVLLRGTAVGQTTAADLPVSEVMTQLSTYMSQAHDRELPKDVIEKAKRHVLDTIAAMVSGSELAPGRAAIAFARAYGGKQIATVIADTTLCGPIEAAMANGVMAHADETDDTLAGPWHPGCAVVPAALAAGEQFAISGAQFLRAVVLGYDVGTRVLLSMQPGLTASHKLTFGIGGAFGAAAAAGCAAGLSPQQMRWLLSYSAQQSSGINSFPRDIDHVEKGFLFGGIPARNGVTAALLIHGGWNGVNDIFSGPDNFLDANTPSPKPEVLAEKLGERFDVMRASIKRWTTGNPNQAPLDALEALLKRQPIDPNQVQEIVVTVPGSLADNDNSGPSDINIQHALAVMLTDKTLTFRSIHDKARMQDPAIVRLRAKVRLVTGVRGPRPPLIQITMADGSHLSQDTVSPGVLGTPANPMSRDQLVAKCRDLMTPVLGAKTQPLIDRVLQIETAKNIRELRPLLQRNGQAGSPRLSEYPNAKS